MSTPVMRTITWAVYFLALVVVSYMFMVLVTHAYTFHENYTAHMNKIAEEKWLLERCQDPMFYSNMRQHSDLCDIVNLNARRSAILTALNAIAANTFLCGNQTCLSLIEGAVAALGWRLLAFAAGLTLFAPNLFWFAASAWRLHNRKPSRDRFIAPHYDSLDDDWDHRQLRRRSVARIDDGDPS